MFGRSKKKADASDLLKSLGLDSSLLDDVVIQDIDVGHDDDETLLRDLENANASKSPVRSPAKTSTTIAAQKKQANLNMRDINQLLKSTETEIEVDINDEGLVWSFLCSHPTSYSSRTDESHSYPLVCQI